MFRKSHTSELKNRKTGVAMHSVVEVLEGRQLCSASPFDMKALVGSTSPLSDSTDIGLFNTHRSRTVPGFIGGDIGGQDVYKLEVTAPVTLSVKLSSLKQDVQAQLLFADGSPIDAVQNHSARTESIVQRLDPGTYYVDLTTSGWYANRYTLNVKSAKARPGSVAAQPSSNLATDAPLGELSLPTNFPGWNSPSSPSTPSSNGTIPDGITPDPTQNLVNYGGYTMQDLQFANIYVGGSAWSSSDMTNIDNALSGAMSDSVLNSVMQQYFSGTITSKFLGSAVLSGSVPGSVDQIQLENYIAALDQYGYLKDFSLNTTCFNFMLPSGTVLSQGSVNSLNGLGGYHGSVHATNPNGTQDTIYYAIGAYSETFFDGTTNGIPAFDQNWKNVVGTFYHELNEVRTDPDIEDAINTNNQGYCGWISNQGNEIGDYPIFEATNAGLPLSAVFSEVPLSDGSGTVPIQLMWSNQAAAPVNPTGSGTPASTPSGWWGGLLLGVY